MANLNYVLLERVTVGETAVSSITFNSIPQTGYTDLKVVSSNRSTAADTNINNEMIFNGNTSSYTTRRIYGAGTSGVGSSTQASSAHDSYSLLGQGANLTSNTFTNGEFYIPNYTSSNYKSISSDNVLENNAVFGYNEIAASLWSNASAITSIKITCGNGNFVQYSTFSLYGLAAVGTTPTIAPKATGGSIIQTDGTYWYHAFLASGTFTPAVGLTCDYLVVAGGASGGSGGGGGGGAGAFRTDTSQSLTATGYTVTVGAGGAANTGTNARGNAGSTSSVNSLSSTGGGGGGAYGVNNGNSGGSGGGAGSDGTTGTGGAGGTGGYAGGNVTANVNLAAGGGGGAGAVGSANSGTVGGAGGVGSSNAISGGATTAAGALSGGIYYFAGGGGGGVNSGAGPAGAGGLGGGGAGGVNGVGRAAGTANTGGGGGGSTNGNGMAGGSGIVIVRYLVA